MARETTLKFNFLLEKSRSARLPLTGAGITPGTATLVLADPADTDWATNQLLVAAGNMVYIENTGLPSLDGRVHMITQLNATTGVITLQTDSSSDTQTLGPQANINVRTFVWDHVCLSEFTPSPGTPGEIDVTTMCDLERRNLPGLPTPGTASFTGMFDFTDPGMQALINAQRDALPRYMIGVSRRGQQAVFHGIVSSFSIGAMTVEAALTFTGTFTLDQSPYYMVNPVLSQAA